MYRGILAVTLLMMWVARTAGPAEAGGKDVCISISDMYKGRNCGTSDSVQVEVRNDCGVKVTGSVVFNQASGDPIVYRVTLNSGDKQTVWACHGNGTVGKDFDVER